MVKAYYIEEDVADPRAPNIQSPDVPARFETLNLLNCFYKYYDPAVHFAHYNAADNAHINNEKGKDDVPLPEGEQENKTPFETGFVYPLLAELGYKHYDLITVSPEALGAKFDTISAAQLCEHIHEDEEVRVIISGEGYFDIRDPISGNLESHKAREEAQNGRHHHHEDDGDQKGTEKRRYAFLSQLHRQITDSADDNAGHIAQKEEAILQKWEHLLDVPLPHFASGEEKNGHANGTTTTTTPPGTSKFKQPPPRPAWPHEQKQQQHNHHHPHHAHHQHHQEAAPFHFRNQWIRIAVAPGDCLVVPKGIYHRFTTTTAKHITALRLFKDNPKWVSLSSPVGDSSANADRRGYLHKILFRNVFGYETAVGEAAAPYYTAWSSPQPQQQHANNVHYNKNIFAFQTFYPEEVNAALQQILARFISDVKASPPESQKHTILFYFTASKTPMTGQPWCPDCVRSHPFVKEAYETIKANNNNNNNNNNVLYCEFPVERPAYKQNPSYYYRQHPFFQLNNVPTVFVLTVKPSVLEGWGEGYDAAAQVDHHQHELRWTEWVDVKLKTVDPTVAELVQA